MGVGASYTFWVDRIAAAPSRRHLIWLLQQLNEDPAMQAYRNELVEQLRERARELGEPSVIEGLR